MNRELEELIYNIRKFGPNFYKISRETGTTESTVRYRIKKEISSGNLRLYGILNYQGLGLSQILIFGDKRGIYKHILLPYTRSYFNLQEGYEIIYLTAPKKIKDFLEKNKGELNIDKILYVDEILRPINRTREEFFKLIDYENNEIQTVNMNINRKPDYLDVKLAIELESNPLKKLSEIAKETKTTPQNIFYHTKKHLRNKILLGYDGFLKDKGKNLWMCEIAYKRFAGKIINSIVGNESVFRIYKVKENPLIIFFAILDFHEAVKLDEKLEKLRDNYIKNYKLKFVHEKYSQIYSKKLNLDKLYNREREEWITKF
jgi:DNA-binding Lrp family transcriptional regulator